MGVHTWAYDPERCDGEPCICNCDRCPKAEESENIPFWAAFSAVMNNTNTEKTDD